MDLSNLNLTGRIPLALGMLTDLKQMYDVD